MLKFDFSGKKVLVTGAGQGIGRELVKALYLSHATVIALSKSPTHLQSLSSECPGVATIVCDVSDIGSIENAVSAYLPLDCLVNNAGTQAAEPFLLVSQDSFDRVMTVNLKAPLFLSQIVAKSMVHHQIRGSIVNISSQASQLCISDHTSYACSKSALDTLTRQMCYELGPRGIRVNSVLPTVVLTELGRQSWSDPAKATPMLQRIPLGRFAEIQDVVDATMFLLSDAAKMISGVQLPVDGGATA